MERKRGPSFTIDVQGDFVKISGLCPFGIRGDQVFAPLFDGEGGTVYKISELDAEQRKSIGLG